MDESSDIITDPHKFSIFESDMLEIDADDPNSVKNVQQRNTMEFNKYYAQNAKKIRNSTSTMHRRIPSLLSQNDIKEK